MKHPLLERARREGTPLIDGENVTFVWHGRQAPVLLADFNGFDPERAIHLTQAGPGLWATTVALPREAYAEYAFMRGDKSVPDPFNRRTVSNGYGGRNHYFYTPGGRATPLARRGKGVRAGKVTEHVVETWDHAATTKRTIHLYQPPVSDPSALLVVLDGREYLRRAHLPVIVDNLIARNRLRPLALALLDNGRNARLVEYGCSDITLGFLTNTVLPVAREHLNLVDVAAAPGAYGIMGSSIGGLMALYAGLRLPQIFGHVLSQSGAFSVDGLDTVTFDLVRYLPIQPLRVWLSAGTFEELRPVNERMRGLLTARGYDVTYREYHGGHNYPCWRDDLPRGLEQLFGGR